jgi:hypothetical protein
LHARNTALLVINMRTDFCGKGARNSASCSILSAGYGFIQAQGGGKDVFVHISAVERAQD